MNQKMLYIPALLSIFLLSCGGADKKNDPSYTPTRPTRTEISTSPILRINTRMHTAMINRIATDSGNRFLVSASDDKTIRVWKKDGTLLKTLRVPIGEGNEGKLYAVAMTPDGKQIAAGGWTGWDIEGKPSIYILSTDTGELLRRISGLPSGIHHLAYSPNGKYLGASLGENGIRIFTADTYSEVFRDTKYSSQSNGIAFSPDGSFSATGYDGHLRVYSPSFERIAYTETGGGKEPFALSYSRDGSKIAVGFRDSTKVDVYDRYGNFLYSPDTKGIEGGNLGRVAFSRSGNLFAGGKYGNSGTPLLVWEKEGKEKIQTLIGAESTIMHIIPFGEGIAFGSGDPLLGVYEKNLQSILRIPPEIRDYRGVNLKVNVDGEIVFKEQTDKKNPFFFSIDKGYVKTSETELSSPQTESSSLQITNWKNKNNPSLNGTLLSLHQYETSRSLALHPNGKEFALGTEWYLHYLNSSGKKLWKNPVPGPTWAVNISGDGKKIIAAFGDGTIRWYRVRDGKELLALYAHPDGKQWVLFSPEGYYSSSPGGDNLFGWHLNRSMDSAPDFFPASRFRSIFYRPDVVTKILDTLDTKQALAEANRELGKKETSNSIEKLLPPIVTILSPENGTEVSSETVMLSYQIKNPSGEPVTGLKVFLDGRPYDSTRGVSLIQSNTKTITVTIPKKDTTISLIAENKYSAGEPASIVVRWKGKEEFIVLPKLYILAIGISRYKNPDMNLGLAAKDATDFAETMKFQKGKLYREVETKVITDASATKDEVLDGLDWIQKQTTSKDVAMVFLSGHGINESDAYYFLPYNTDLEKIKRTGVLWTEIKNTVANIAGKALFFVDTCHSGNILGNTTRRSALTDNTAIVNELVSAENGVIVFASSTGRQVSLENTAWGNGAFTKALLEGIKGGADYQKTGRITINMIDLYITERVKQLTNGKQTPATAKPETIADFPIAIKK